MRFGRSTNGLAIFLSSCFILLYLNTTLTSNSTIAATTPTPSPSNTSDNKPNDSSSNPLLPLSNNLNLNTQGAVTENVQSGFDIQQGLPLSKTIGIYDLPKNIVLTDDFGDNNKIPIRAFFSDGLISFKTTPLVNSSFYSNNQY